MAGAVSLLLFSAFGHCYRRPCPGGKLEREQRSSSRGRVRSGLVPSTIIIGLAIHGIALLNSYDECMDMHHFRWLHEWQDNPMRIRWELMWMQLHSWFLEKPQDIYYLWTRSCVHSLCLVYLARSIWCTFFSSVICEHRQVDGLQFDELEPHHSPSWTATLVVSLSGLFWHPHWIQVWKVAFHSGDNCKLWVQGDI